MSDETILTSFNSDKIKKGSFRVKKDTKNLDMVAYINNLLKAPIIKANKIDTISKEAFDFIIESNKELSYKVESTEEIL